MARGMPRAGLLGALGIAGATITVGALVFVLALGSPFAQWRTALTDYEQAVSVQDAALAEFEGVVSGFGSALDSFAAAGALLEAANGGSTLVPAAAAAALSAAWEESKSIAGVPELPPLEDRLAAPGALTSDDLEKATIVVVRETQAITAAAAKGAGLAGSADTADSVLRGAIQEFVDAVTSRGESLIAGRQDADVAALAELQTFVDALPFTAEVTELPSLLSGGIVAAEAVVRSSNLHRIDDPNSILVVVNKQRPLQPQDFVPELVRVPVASYGTPVIRPEAADSLVEMFEAFRAETGQRLRLNNSYRSYQTQVGTYSYHVSTKGQAQADRGSARPGHSEHQTGLALDIDAVDGGCSIQQCFGSMIHGQWLAENSWRFGWVVRYPDGYEHITGYDWEPWHLRFVGVEVSTAMHAGGIPTLEDYFGLEPAPTY